MSTSTFSSCFGLTGLGRLNSALLPINFPLPLLSSSKRWIDLPAGLGAMSNSLLFAFTARSNRSPSNSAFIASLISLTGSSSPSRIKPERGGGRDLDCVFCRVNESIRRERASRSSCRSRRPISRDLISFVTSSTEIGPLACGIVQSQQHDRRLHVWKYGAHLDPCSLFCAALRFIVANCISARNKLSLAPYKIIELATIPGKR